jgi:hypothetical protein
LDLNLALGPLMGHNQAQNGALHVGFALTFIGPILPPEVPWKRAFEFLLPDMIMKKVPESLIYAPLSNVVLNKRSWTVALDGDSEYHVTFADKSPSDLVSSSDEVHSSTCDFDLSGEQEMEAAADVSDAMSALYVEQICKSDQLHPRKRGRPKKSTALSPVKVIK